MSLRLALALAAVIACTSALAQGKTRLNAASAFPTSLPLVGDGALKFARRVERASAGALEVRVAEPGALVPALQAIQATSQGSVDAAWSNGAFFAGVDSAFHMFSAVPFGPGSPEYLAWMYHGGGLTLARELYAKYGVVNIPCAIFPPEASGWFRKEIRTVADFGGLKMRFVGLGANVLAKLGAAPQTIAAGDIFQALQNGTIDATEFSVPSIDQKLGFHQVAKFYYFPGWHQQATFVDFYVNQKKWEALPDAHKAIIEQACGDQIRDMIAEGEASQWKALTELRERGVQIRRWSPEILAALEKAWGEVITEESAKNPNFRRVYASYAKFRADYAIWREHGYLK
jgi:TRAP-type mannitol/chloroaromatic compound transport system substrate-binding protein